MDYRNVKTRRVYSAVLFAATFVLACQDAPEPPVADAPPANDTAVTAPLPPAPDTAPAPVTPAAGTLTSSGWNTLRIGMTRAEVVAAAGEDANPNAVGGPDPATCDQFRPTNAPQGLLVMIVNGKLSRISVTGRTGIKTDRGFGVGDTAASIKAAYGAAAVATPHAYGEAPQEYITVWTQPNVRGMVYEIGNDGRVVRMNAGDKSIENVEGCV